MVARTQVSHGLMITFHRDGEALEEHWAADPPRALIAAMAMLATRQDGLLPGDTLRVSVSWDTPELPDLPEPRGRP